MRRLTILTFMVFVVLNLSASAESTPQKSIGSADVTASGLGDNGVYAVGDYYNRDGKEGVVFEVDATGRHGKIVSLVKSDKDLHWSTYEAYTGNLHGPIGNTSESDGQYNMEQISAIDGWTTKFPAFAWCRALGDGWYLPSKDELVKLMEVESSKVDITLRRYGMPLFDGGVSQYWSSTQYSKYQGVSWFYRNGGNLAILHKYYALPVRAIAGF